MTALKVMTYFKVSLSTHNWDRAKNKGHTIGMPLVVVPLQPAQVLSCAIGDHHCLLAASSRKDQARTRLTLLPCAISSTRT